MNKKQIEELKKILYSKIDQLTTLIGDNFKTIHYDYFIINKSNLEEQLLKIREKFKNNNKDNLEILVIKKDIVNLTKDFLDINLLDEIEKEKKKLSKIRKIYIFLIVILIIISVGVYVNYFYLLGSKIIKNLNNKKYISCVNTGNSVSGDTISISTKLGNNSLSGKILSNKNLSNSNIHKNYEGKKLKKINIITGSFFLGKFKNKKYILSGNVIKGNFKVKKNLVKQTIKLINFQTGFNLENNKYTLIQYTGNLGLTGDKILSGVFEINGTITGNIIVGKLLTGNFIIPINAKYKDEIEEKLKGEQLKKYKEEKKIKCPYSGIIKVKVKALNIREKNTKYSKKLGILPRGEKLKVLTCQKNLVANSWWYKVKVLKNGKIGRVSTIGVGK